MDFMQDETNAMEKGIQASKPAIKKFKNKLKKGKGSSEYASAKSMWENNELHQRPRWYMLHHGEGGFYKEEASSAQAKNRAMTDQLVNLAADMYKPDSAKAALSVLSDAVHQAEDRGSHQEGEKFTGHDVRQTIDIRPTLDKDSSWEKGQYQYRPKYDPDNASLNSEGASRALSFAAATLHKFLNKLESKPANTPVALSGAKDSARKRHSKFKKKVTATSGHFGNIFLDTTHSKVITGLNEYEMPSIGKTELSGTDRAMLRLALENYVVGWLGAEITETIRATKMKSKSKNLAKIAGKAFDSLMDKNQETFDRIGLKHDKSRLVAAAVKNYRFQKKKIKPKRSEVMNDLIEINKI